MTDELKPILDVEVEVELDGDDDPQRSLENVVTLLKGALAEMQGFGAIRDFSVTVRT